MGRLLIIKISYLRGALTLLRNEWLGSLLFFLFFLFFLFGRVGVTKAGVVFGVRVVLNGLQILLQLSIFVFLLVVRNAVLNEGVILERCGSIAIYGSVEVIEDHVGTMKVNAVFISGEVVLNQDGNEYRQESARLDIFDQDVGLRKVVEVTRVNVRENIDRVVVVIPPLLDESSDAFMDLECVIAHETLLGVDDLHKGPFKVVKYLEFRLIGKPSLVAVAIRVVITAHERKKITHVDGHGRIQLIQYGLRTSVIGNLLGSITEAVLDKGCSVRVDVGVV